MSNRPAPLSREDIAKLEIGVTDIRPRLARLLTGFFCLFILAVPVFQAVQDVRANPGGWPQAVAGLTWRVPPADPGATHWQRLTAVNRDLLAHLGAWEDTVEDRSFLRGWLLSPLQSLFARAGAGNEKAYIGRDGWLYYRPDFDTVVGKPFSVLPSVEAIRDFQRQLDARGIRLVIMPVPSKAGVATGPLGLPPSSARPVLHNPAYETWKARLAEAGVDVFDPGGQLSAAGEGAYLRTDTHWTPAAMETVAASLARHLLSGPLAGAPRSAEGLTRGTRHVTALGDIAVMLKLAEDQTLLRPETVVIHPVAGAGGRPWAPEGEADVLLLGDSFANIFSLEVMQWGAQAGLAEQLAFSLQRPVDAIVRNDAGSHATRDMLAQELAAGRDRLAGKRVVVWQFAARELETGNWKQIALELKPAATDAGYLALAPGASLAVTARVAQATPVPKPGTVAYADHIRSLLLEDLRGKDGQPLATPLAVAYARSMTAHKWTTAADWQPGQVVSLRAQPWSAQSPKLGSINRSELQDDELMMVDPVWVEPVAQAAVVSEPAAGRIPALVGIAVLFLVAGIRFHREDGRSRP